MTLFGNRGGLPLLIGGKKSSLSFLMMHGGKRSNTLCGLQNQSYDTDMPCLGEVYENTDTMLERMREIIKASESDPFEVFYNEIKGIVTKSGTK